MNKKYKSSRRPSWPKCLRYIIRVKLSFRVWSWGFAGPRSWRSRKDFVIFVCIVLTTLQNLLNLSTTGLFEPLALNLK